MVRGSLSAFFVLILFGSVAHAQFSIYGTAAVTDYGHTFNGGSLTIYSGNVGYGGGVSYMFPSDRRLRFGVDYRGYVTPATQGGNTGVLSFRVGLVPRRAPFRPYFVIGPGYASAKTPGVAGSQSIDVAVLGLGGGLDIPVARHLDLRVIEVESTESITSTKKAGTASLGGGVVVHF
jgi:hypothetical protein